MSRIVTHLCSLVLLLSVTACHQNDPVLLVFSEDVPDGVPDTSGWDNPIEGSTNDVMRNIHSRSVSGNDPIASLMIVEGICPDTDEPCPFSLLYSSAYRKNGDAQKMDWVVRWVLMGGGERAEGVSHMTRSGDGPYVRMFWLREGDSWERFEEDSIVAVKLSRFTHDLLSFIMLIESRKSASSPPQ